MFYMPPNNVTFGIRHFLRDNWLCNGRIQKLLAHEQLDAESLARLQTRMLSRALGKAAQQLPAYAALRVPTNLNEIVPFMRQTVPIVTKQDLVAARQSFYPNGGAVRPWTISGKTSGTTGSPLDVFRSLSSVVWERAFVHRHWQWSGFRQGMRHATLRGDNVVDLNVKSPPYWLENKIDSQLLLSTRHLNHETARHFAVALAEYSPVLLQAYPSAVFVLAQALAQTNRKLNIPWVFTASEMLFPYQRELIEARVGRVMDFYGMAERVAFASECEHGNLHVNTDYSFVEILDEKNQPTDGDGYVVGTTFHNDVMPLIRYKLSDRTRWKPGTCQCGRPFPMIEPIQGKFEDVLFGSTGSAVSPSIITFAFKGVANIESSQVAQTGPGIWVVRVVPGPGYVNEDGERVLKNIHTLIDSGLSLSLVLRKEIERTNAGKYRWIVNEWQTKPIPPQ